MIDVLISGNLQGVPTLRAVAGSKPFAMFKVLVTDKTGEDVLCKCITFSADVADAVQGLPDGGGITLMGELAVCHRAGAIACDDAGLDVAVYRVLRVCGAGCLVGAVEPHTGPLKGFAHAHAKYHR